MSEGNEAQWKEKYLELLDTVDKNQTEHDAQLELLRKSLVRVSLAAEGLDRSLDEQLNELRAALRKESSTLALEPLLKRLERSVVALDDRRKDEHSEIQSLVELQLEQLADIDLDRSDRNQIKKIRQMLPGLLSSNGINPELWKSILHLQSTVTQHLQAHITELKHAGDHKGGFISKLFHSRDNKTIPPIDDPETDIEPDQSKPEKPATLTPKQPDQESLTREIAHQFNVLIEQLDVPVEQMPRKISLVDQINGPFNLNRIPKFLDETAQLVATTRVVAQKEFEGFLMALHQRLQEVQEFLGSAREGEEASLAHQKQLDHDVRKELKEIRTNLESSSDISRLKLDIEGMVNRIVESVDNFQMEEKSRRQKVYEHIETLATRMQSMESEAVELKNNMESQRVRALQDSLTDLPNRASYDEYIASEHSRWSRHGRPLSLAVIDIDYFKRINDTLGHLRGDKVLRLVAREISRRVRKEDFVARYGGEEFVVVLPETDIQSAMIAMEKVRAYVADCPFNFNQQPIPVTISIGISTFLPGDTIEACFDRADKALYRAKAEGRNKVEQAEMPETTSN